MLEEGIYLGYIDTAVTTESGSKKTPAMAITFTVTQKAIGEKWQSVPDDPKVTVYLYLSDAAWPYSERKLQQLGFNGNFDDPQWSEKTIAEGVNLECKHEEYEGRTRERWDFVGGAAAAKADNSVTSRLSARWKQGNAPKPVGRPTPPPRPAKTQQDAEHEKALAEFPA